MRLQLQVSATEITTDFDEKDGLYSVVLTPAKKGTAYLTIDK